MKKFGLSRKDKSASGSPAPDDDANRSALFGSRKSNKAGPPGGNPYAQASGNPYAQQTASPSGGQYGGMGAPPAYDGQLSDRQRTEKSAVPAGGYGGGDRFGGGGNNYGSQGGYGADRYGNGNSGAPRRAGGYGGLGGDDDADDAGRNALFGNASERFQQQKPGGLPSQQRPQGSNGQSGMGAAYGEDGQGYGGGYGARYQDRQLTAEEQEEEEVTGMKQEIRQIKQSDVSSTRNALRLAAQAEASGRATAERMQIQGDGLYRTDRSLTEASSGQDVAKKKTEELKVANGSMFAVHVANPFTKSRNRNRAEEELLTRNEEERQAREANRKAKWESEQRAQGIQKIGQDGPGGYSSAPKARNLAERSKYQFEADSEDDEMENEIEDNLDAMHGAVRRLGVVARGIGEEAEAQNRHMERISQKTDKVEDQLTLNRARLDRIR